LFAELLSIVGKVVAELTKRQR